MIDTATPPTEADTSAKVPSKPQIVKIELSELGPMLPLGIPDANGKLHREIVCKPWRGREEREVGKLKAEGQKRGDFASRLLAHMFTRVGEHDFATMEDAAKQAVISQMYLGDVLYMYVWLRTQCVDDHLKMTLNCPHCDHEFPFDADLGTIEVRTADSLDAVKWQYALKHPFDLRGKKASGFELSPTRWVTMEETTKKNNDTNSPNMGAAKMDVIRSCIQGVTDREQMVVTENELDNMTKVDIERLTSKIDENEIGPDLSVSQACPKCKRKFVTSLDWSYASFFETSSLS